MAHTMKDDDIGAKYEGTTPTEMVEASRRWDALLAAALKAALMLFR